MRISKKDENSLGKKNCQPSPPQRTQAPDHSLKFPKRARLLSKIHYQKVSKSGSRFFGDSVVIDYFTLGSNCPKLGITVSKKFGKAHVRNRFKRVVREAFRLLQPFLPKSLEINVLPKGQGLTSLAAVSKDIHSLLEQLKC